MSFGNFLPSTTLLSVTYIRLVRNEKDSRPSPRPPGMTTYIFNYCITLQRSTSGHSLVAWYTPGFPYLAGTVALCDVPAMPATLATLASCAG